MANPQQELDQIKARIESLKQELGKKGIDVINIKDLDTAKTLLRGLEDEADGLSMTFGDISTTLANIVSELSRSDTATKSATRAYKGLLSIAQKMQYEEEGIYSYNVKQLDNLHSQAKSQLVNLKTAIDRLKAEGDTSEEAQALTEAYNTQLKLETSLSAAIYRRLELEKKVEKTVGATGAALQTTSKILDKMGFGNLSSEVSELGEKLKGELREEIKKSNGQAANLGTSFKYVGKAISGSAKILSEGLKDPLVIVSFIVDALAQGSQKMADLQKQTGMSYGSAYKLNNEMNAVAAATGDAFITGEKLGKAYASLTNELGVSADILGNKALVSATNLEQRLGMSAEQSSKLTVFARLQGKDTEKVLGNATATVGAFNNQNKTAINVKAVMDDVANASASTYLNMGKNVTALTQAATKAKSLGLSLQDLETVSESLLDFESSIGSELEAQLLTGGNINLAKAREYALTGDMKGLGDEIGKQQGILNAFRRKDVVAQNAAAKALGLTRDQLAKMTMQQELNSMGAENFKKQYGESAYESMKARSAAEGFGDAMEKIKSILGGIFQALSPVLDALVMVLNIPFVPQILAGLVVAKLLAGSLMGSAKSMGSLAKGAIDFVKNMNPKGMMEYLGKLKSAFGEGLGGKAQEAAKGLGDKVKDAVTGKAEDAAGGLADKAKDAVVGKAEDAVGKATEAAGSVPEKTGGGMSSLTDSIQKIKPSQLLAGGAALIMVAASVYIFAKAAQEFATVSWEDMAKAGVGLLGLVGALALVGAIMMSGVGALAIMAGAAAIVIMAGGLYILGKALQEVGEGMQMMEPALALVSSIGDKAAGLATIGASLLGIAAGLREIGTAGVGAIPVLEALGKISPTAAPSESTSAGQAKGKSEEGSLMALELKLTELITAVKAGGNVYLDTNKVGRAQVLGSYKSS